MINNNIQRKCSESSKKSIWVRISSLLLSLVFSIVFVIDNSITVLAVDTNEPFNVYTYMANNILSDDTPAGKRFNYYYNDVKSMAQIWNDSMTDDFINSVIAWEALEVAIEPSQVFDKSIDARGYYMTVILSMMETTYSLESSVNMLDYSSVKDASKLYNSFCKLYKDITNVEVESIINDAGFSEEGKEIMKEAQEEFLKENGFLAVGQDASNVLKALDLWKKPSEYLEHFIQYCNVFQTTKEWKECLQKMYEKCDKNNLALTNALQILVDSSQSLDNAVLQITMDAAEETGVHFMGKAVDGLMDTLLGEVNIGVDLGKTIGKALNDILFGTEKDVESFYIISVYCQVMDLFKSVFNDVQRDYLKNRTPDNAKRFLAYMEMYFTALNTGNEFGQDFSDVMYSGGIVNLIWRSQEEYKKITKNTDFFVRSTKEAYDYITIAWLNTLYEDTNVENNLELYEVYADIIKNKVGMYIPVSRVQFEQDSVEWGLYDFDYRGYECYAYPESATCRELTYTSSDPSVAEITNNGDVKVRGIGNCDITAKSVDWEEITDTLNVTVIPEGGVDSTKREDIEPIEPVEPNPTPSVDYGNVVHEGEIDQAFWKLNDEGALFVGGKGKVSVFSGAVTDDILKSIPWFQYKDEIISIKVLNGITELGQYIFAGCSRLETIELPESLKKIGWRTFYQELSLKRVGFMCRSCDIDNNAFDYHGKETSFYTYSGSNISDYAWEHSIEEKSIYALEVVDGSTVGKSVISTSLNSIKFVYARRLFGKDYSGYTFTSENPDDVEIGEVYISDDGINFIINVGEKTSNINYYVNDTFAGEFTMTADGNNSFVYDGFICKLNETGVTICSFVNEKEYLSKNKVVTLPETVSIGQFSYKVNDIADSAFVDTGIKNVVIGKNIKRIGRYAFAECDLLESVLIPATVEELNYGIFADCDLLESVTIENGISAISDEMFSQCVNLKNIVLPDSITEIGECAFENCTMLDNVTLPSMLESVGERAFYACKSISELHLTKKLKTMGRDAFGLCTNATVYALGIRGGFDDAYQAFLYEPTEEGNGVNLTYKTQSLTTVSLPDTVEGFPIVKLSIESSSIINLNYMPNTITSIGGIHCENIEKIVFSDSITAIPDYCFNNEPNLKDVVFPKALKIIGREAFQGCQSLEIISLPVGLEEIYPFAFYNLTGLIFVEIPHTVTKIGNYAFQGCKNAVIYYPDNISGNKYVNNGYLKDTNDNIMYSMNDDDTLSIADIEIDPQHDSVVLPDEICGYPVTNIKRGALNYGPNLKTITIGPNICEIENGALCGERGHSSHGYTHGYSGEVYLERYIVSPDNTKFKSENGILFSTDGTRLVDFPALAMAGETYVLPDGVLAIDECAFYKSRLNGLILNRDLKTVGDYAFAKTDIVGNVVLPQDVEYIGKLAFTSDSAIFYYPSSAEVSTAKDQFDYFYDENSVKYEVLDGNNVTLSNARITTIKVWDIPSKIDSYSVKAIGADNIFSDDHPLEEIIVPDGVERLETKAFYCYDSNIARIVLPKSLKHIGSKAIVNHGNLSTLVIPENVESIGEEAFWGNGFEKVYFDGCKLKVISKSSFENCENLNSIAIPYGVECIESSAFNSCKNLSNVIMPSTLKQIKGYAFQNCTNIDNILIPYGGVKLDSFVFSGCSALKNIFLPKDVSTHDYMSYLNDLTVYGYKNTVAESIGSVEGHTFVLIDDNLTVNFTDYLQKNMLNCGDVKSIDLTCGNGFIPHLQFESSNYGIAGVEESKYKGNGIYTIEVRGIHQGNADIYAVIGEQRILITSIVVGGGFATHTIYIPNNVTVTNSLEKIINNGDEIHSGDILRIEANVPDGKTLSLLTVNGSEIKNGSIYTVSDDNVVIQVQFKDIETQPTPDIKYTITIPQNVEVTRLGSALKNGDEIREGDNLTITATAPSGYRLKLLTVNGESFSNGDIFTVGKEDVVISASFRKISTGGSGSSGRPSRPGSSSGSNTPDDDQNKDDNPNVPTNPDNPSDPGTSDNPSDPGTPDNPDDDKNNTSEQPFLNSNSSINGWDNILVNINEELTKVIAVDMNGTTILPGKVLQAIKGKDVKLILKMDEKISWSIEGGNVKKADQDIDLKVTMNTDIIPNDAISELVKEREYFTLSLNHNGDFGFDAFLVITVGTQYDNEPINLFWYNNNKFKSEDTGKVQYGMAVLKFTHASDWLAVFGDDKSDAGTSSSGSSTTSDTSQPIDVKPNENKPNESNNSKPTATEPGNSSDDEKKNPNTGNSRVSLATFLALITSAAVALISQKRKK